MSADMRLDELLAGVADAGAAAAMRVRGLCLDSRRVNAGEAFVALRGLQHHGIEFAATAIERGASVILAEAPPPAGFKLRHGRIIWVADLSARLGELAARFFGQPGDGMRITGVTGTNGKTSIVQLLSQACTLLDRVAASIGTLGAGLHGAVDAGERTTPDAIKVQALLADFHARGVTDVQMEVSSHALMQGRVNAVPFGTAVFTNLSRDHLDYHGSMEAYFEAKARLFAWPTLQCAVLNRDDPHGRELSARLPADLPQLGFGIDTGADVRASNLRSHADGFDFVLTTPWGSAPVHTRLLGRFNVANLLAMVACLGAQDVAFNAICRMLPLLEPVRGRMNRIGGDGQPLVVVDYAHTPQALELALTGLRPHARGRLLCVFGAGGDRDRGKRPQMGAIAEALADSVVITDDNPRSEDGDAIVAAIRAGLKHPAAAVVERDRARAIALAIAEASPDDVVLIAGKGHETTQEDARGQHPFNDLEVAEHLLAGRAAC